MSQTRTTILNLKLLAVTVVLGAGGFYADPSAAAESVTVGGTSYTITTETGSYDSLLTTLEAQPFFGSATEADAFATALGAADPDVNNGVNGPFFAYGANAHVEFYTFDSIPDVVIAPSAQSLTASAVYAIATPVATTSSVPEPASITLLGIGGIAAAALRRRRRCATAP